MTNEYTCASCGRLGGVAADLADWLCHTCSKVLVCRPGVQGGAPLFRRGAGPLDAVMGRIRAGDSIESVAHDFDVPVDDIVYIMRSRKMLPTVADMAGAFEGQGPDGVEWLREQRDGRMRRLYDARGEDQEQP